VDEKSDETTGITNREIIDWRANPRGSALRPAIVIRDKPGGKVLKLPRGGEARYLLSVGAILSTEPEQKVKAGDVLSRISLESAKRAISRAVFHVSPSCSKRAAQRITPSSPRSQGRYISGATIRINAGL